MAEKKGKEKAAKKAVQTQIPDAPKQKGAKQPKVKFVSFSFGATIPTQAYGNLTPHITVEAPTYEEARDFAIPKIEELYRKYADGKPAFLSRVTETVKEVAPVAATPTPAAIAETPAETVAVAPVNTAPKPEPVIKAEKAIALLEDEASALRIQTQIEQSTKIPPEFKQGLLELCLKKRKEIEGK